MALHLIRAGRVVFKAIIALDGDLACRHVKNDVSKTAAIVFISERHQSLKALL